MRLRRKQKKKTDIKKQLEEVKQTFKEGILYKINKLIIDLKKYENDLDDFIKNRKDLFMNIYKNIPDKQKPKNKKEAQKTADKINNNLNEKQYNIEKEIGNIFKELIKIKTDNDILLNKDELDFIDENKIETISTKEYKEMKRKAEDIEKKRIEDEKEFNRELTKEETIKKYGSYLIDKSKMPIRNTLHILDDIINKKSILELVYDNSYVRPDGTRVDGAYIIIKKLIENNIDLSKPIFKDLIKALKEEYKGDIFNLKETFNIDY